MRMSLRPAAPDDGAALQQIERLAGERFREVGLDLVADAEPDSLGVLARYAREERAWVCVDELDHPLGYLLADAVDGNAHISQLSVHPAAQGKGIGRLLLAKVSEWAERSNRSATSR